MSNFRPSSVFATMDKLPPFIQDYSYILSQYSNQVMVVDPAESELYIPTITDNLITHLTPMGNYTLTVRSEDGFDQTTEELQTANIPYQSLSPRLQSAQSPAVSAVHRTEPPTSFSVAWNGFTTTIFARRHLRRPLRP